MQALQHRGRLGRMPVTFAGRASLACGLMLGAIAVHSLFYNAFFEDPMAWGLFALIALAAGAAARREELG